MTAARQLIGLIKSHISGDETGFYAIAMQIAAGEARQGHRKLADEVKQLVDDAKAQKLPLARKSAPVLLAQPKGELAGLLSVRYPEARLSDMVLNDELGA